MTNNFSSPGLTDEQKAEILRLWNTHPDMSIRKIAQEVGVTTGQAAGWIATCKKKGQAQNKFKPNPTPILRAIGPNPALMSAHAQLKSQFQLAVKAKAKTDARYHDLKTALAAIEALIGDKSE